MYLSGAVPRALSRLWGYLILTHLAYQSPTDNDSRLEMNLLGQLLSGLSEGVNLVSSQLANYSADTENASPAGRAMITGATRPTH